MTPRTVATAEASAEGGSWRELAVARSLDPARVRAEKRVQRFLDAALDLMQRAPDKEFTVQEVVERSGQSLRSFYQYFAGKHELLLALFEESVRSTADQLREMVASEKNPRDRLHRFATEYYLICRPSSKGKAAKTRPTPAMAEFAQQLLTSHPDEAARAFVPLVSLLTELLDDAAAAGALRRVCSTRGSRASCSSRSCSMRSPPRSVAPPLASRVRPRPKSCGTSSCTASAPAVPEPTALIREGTARCR